RHVRKVVQLDWHTESFAGLFKIVDAAPGMEKDIFTQTGRSNHLPRVRLSDAEMVNKKPPKHPQVVFPSGVFGRERETALGDG
ncbi:hypothetical protein K435DRAFT_672128, partial [Dendrothele bispora CBS 962.96]